MIHGLRWGEVSEGFINVGSTRRLLRSRSRTAIAVSIHCRDLKSVVNVIASGVRMVEEIGSLGGPSNKPSVLVDFIVRNPIVILAGRPCKFDSLDTKVCS